MSDPYSRLYHRFEREYPDIYRDDAAYALWCRLLPLADASWPTKPPVPRSAKKAALHRLTEAGLVVLDGDRYEIRGMAKERLRRSQHAQSASHARWNARSIAASNAQSMPRREEDETRRDETRRDETRREEARDPVVAYMKLTGCGRPPEGGYLERKLRSNSERYGFDEWLFAVNQAREIYGTKNDIRNAEVIAEERYVAAKQRAEDERRSSAPKLTPEQAAANAARVREITAQITRREPPKEAA